MPYEEMADVLGLPLNTVRTRLHRAKARLKAALEGVV
jgi:DNA-directed RNA polymerase specialized sigma24 family protein